LHTTKKGSNILAVIIIAIALCFALDKNKDKEISSSISVDSLQHIEKEQSKFNFNADIMINHLGNNGYTTSREMLKYLDVYVAKRQAENILVRFDIYHNISDKAIEWVEITVDSTAYFGINKPNALPNTEVVEATSTVASQVFNFPFFQNEEDLELLKNWLGENISSALKQGEIYETEIGNLYFTMYGNPYMRFLEITSEPKK